jgi:hypothetical protein
MLAPNVCPTIAPPNAALFDMPVRRDLLSIGRRLARRLADSDNQAALLAAATDGLTEELGLQLAAVALLDADGAPAWRTQRGLLPAARLDDADRLVATVCRSGEPANLVGHGTQRLTALPLRGRGRVLGALVVAQSATCDAGLEDALMLMAAHLAAMVAALHENPAVSAAPAASNAGDGSAIVVRRYAANDSLFVGDRYLIKGVAGNILWKLLSEHQRSGRRSFSNKELRVDPALRLPEIGDNLEARLILLRRRLAAHGSLARIEPTGRGRFELSVARPLQLVEVA